MPAIHLRKPFDPTQVRRIAAEMEIRRRSLGADLVVVRGLSGTLVASAMSVLFETPFAVVRKPDEKSQGFEVEIVEQKDDKPVHYNNWVIVDDLIASGRTVGSIFESIDGKKDIIKGECVAILLYDSEYPITGCHHYDSTREYPVYHIGSVKPKSTPEAL